MQENIEQATGSNIALLPPAERAVIVLDSTKTEAQLRELVEQSAGILEVLDPAGREQAHRAGMNLRNARIMIEKTGKAARDDATKFSKAVIAEEQKLIAISEPEEKRVIILRDAYDAKIAAEKAERERKEAERKARIQGMISSIRAIPINMTGASAAELADEIAELESFKPGDEFAEFADDATSAANGALEALRGLHGIKVAQEAEAARVAAEKAELERLRAEQEKRDREAAEAAAEAARQREAEQARLDAERRQFEAERAEFQRQQEEAARVKEQAEAEVRAAAEKLAKDQEEASKINAAGHYYSETTFRDDGQPIMCNPDGTRNIFCDVDEGIDPAGEPPVALSIDMGSGAVVADQWSETEIELFMSEPSAPLEVSKIITPAAELTATTADDADLVEGFKIMVAGLYETRSADAIRELLDSVLAELECKEAA